MYKTDFIDKDGNPHPDNERITSELLAMDYIVTENDENLFFLTASGYDCVEEINGKKEKIISDSSQIQPEHLKEMIHKLGAEKYKKYIFVWLISFGIFATLYKYFFPRTFQNNKQDIEVVLTKEVIDDIKKKTEQKIDSIKNK